MITICQCNIHDGGRWTGRDRSTVTYDTSIRFSDFVAVPHDPPIALVGMQEVLSNRDLGHIRHHLQEVTGAGWEGRRISQGANAGSGIGFLWRPDLVRTQPDWDLGWTELERLDNRYIIRFAGRIFEAGGAFAFFTGKLAWKDAELDGRQIDDSQRALEAERLIQWIEEVLAPFRDIPRMIAMDLNAPSKSAAWMLLNEQYSDPGRQHTHNSFLGPALRVAGKRLDYLWVDRRALDSGRARFVSHPRVSPHFGSDHRAVYATLDFPST